MTDETGKRQRGGIKTEAVGRYFTHGEIAYNVSKEISKNAKHFHILFEHDFNVHKMLALANKIKERAETLVKATQCIADSSPKEVKE